MLIGEGHEDRALSEEQVRELAARGLEQAELRDKRVLVLIPDSTRTAPVPLFFRLFCELVGSKARKLDFLIALGTHPPMPAEKIDALVGMSAAERAERFPGVAIFNPVSYTHLTLPTN